MTTHRVPWEMLMDEWPRLGKLPARDVLAPYLREDRKVARDGFVSWEGSRYGVHWKWAGRTVHVGQRQGKVEVWAGDERIAVHPRAQKPGQVFVLPGQWSGLPVGDSRPRREAMAVLVPVGEVERRSLRCTSWQPWEVPDDCLGAGPPASGEPGTQAGRGGPGQHSRCCRQQAPDLSRDAGATAGRRAGGPP